MFLHYDPTVPPLCLHSSTIKPLDLHWTYTGAALESHWTYTGLTIYLHQHISTLTFHTHYYPISKRCSVATLQRCTQLFKTTENINTYLTIYKYIYLYIVNSKHLFFYLKITSATLQRCNAATLHHPRLSQSESSHLHKSMPAQTERRAELARAMLR